jgi:AraC family transcriptional regulator, regulatory protein of adaptative response / methylated-DNA-[protein]-cysteine methyltransferase
MSPDERQGQAVAARADPHHTGATDAVKLQRVVRACRAMVEHGGPLPAAELQQVVGCSSRQLARDCAVLLDVSPRAFGHAVRTGHARSLLRSCDHLIDAIFEAGFGSVRGFYETSAPTLGMAPSAYASGGAGQLLRWTSVGASMGTVLAVVGDLGLTAVRIGPDQIGLLDEVRSELPAAHLIQADHELAEAAAALRALADGHPAQVDLPVDVGGTAFQARVWSALRRIPTGQTRSYAEVATEVGAPSAGRAVARACAANRLALVVPCHRVVRSDGTLGGYRWGLAVKQALIDAERARAGA